MSIARSKTAVVTYIDQEADSLWELSRELHQNPEISLEEHFASRRLSAFLRERGFRVQKGIAGLPTAFLAQRSGSKPGKSRVSFLAEYDALPKIGHACGHNIIAAASVGAAAALAKTLPPKEGGIAVFGTPGEEKGGGKVIMSRKGIFRGVDAALMIHPAAETRAEVNFLALAEIYIHFEGKASHAAAAPEAGISALEATLATFQSIAAMRPGLPPGDSVYGVITEGGEVPNIIPDKSASWFYVRSATRKGLEALLKKVKNCAQAAAKTTGARLRFVKSPITYEPLRMNSRLAALFRENLAALGEREADPLPPLAMGSSDVGNVSQKVPTIHPQIRMVPEDVFPHTPAFARAAGGKEGRRTLLLGAKALAMTALDLLLDEKAREEVWKEFRARARAAAPRRRRAP
ncbi:MAG: M20 family metallopeptidase [bacterium]|nr:M20 family metallopeptidase [bacterium]